jgi:hypothetical protein
MVNKRNRNQQKTVSGSTYHSSFMVCWWVLVHCGPWLSPHMDPPLYPLKCHYPQVLPRTLKGEVAMALPPFFFNHLPMEWETSKVPFPFTFENPPLVQNILSSMWSRWVGKKIMYQQPSHLINICTNNQNMNLQSEVSEKKSSNFSKRCECWFGFTTKRVIKTKSAAIATFHYICFI